ncbi:MAG: FHA domain-containing protein, partial [Planctomycetota bacterium]
MPEKSWTIGSDPSCDLVVQSNTVSARHCRLTVDGREWKLTDLGSTNGTYVNGERLFGDRAVELTDSITLGQSQPMPWPDRPKSLDQADTDTAPSAAKSTKSQRKIISIGRGPNNDVVLRDSNVSTNHARLIVAGTEIQLEDLGSTNGTSIGKVENKISRGTVQLNDTVFFGSTSYLVSDLLGQPQPVLVEPEIRPKRDVTSPSMESRRRVTLAVSSLGVLLLLVGFGWWFRSRPNEAETERAETKTPLSNLPETAVATDSLKSTSEEEKRVPAVMEPVEDDVSPEERLARAIFLVVCSDSERETPYRVG